MKCIIIEVDQPNWDDGDYAYLEERLLAVISNEVPGDSYSFQVYGGVSHQ